MPQNRSRAKKYVSVNRRTSRRRCELRAKMRLGEEAGKRAAREGRGEANFEVSRHQEPLQPSILNFYPPH